MPNSVSEWLSNIEFAFNKKDYFILLLLFFILYWVFSITFTMDNIIILVPTCLILYIYINKKINKNFASMQQQNDKLLALGIDKYPYLQKDIDTVDIFISIKDLILIDRLKFIDALHRTDVFYYFYENTMTNPQEFAKHYETARNEAKTALNVLMSYIIELDIVPKDEYTGTIYVTDSMVRNSVDKLKKRFQLYMNRMEVSINKDWLDGNITIDSKPIYPDEVEPTILDDKQYLANYNLY
jgi:hypothetical protein